MTQSAITLDDYSRIIHTSRYARYLPDVGRRETWEETVERFCNFWYKKYPVFPYDEMYSAILNMEIMPSMRALMTAGEALDRDNMAGYNCSYIAVDDVRAFDETLYVLMCGTGVGFSVERQFIANLPCVAEEFHDSGSTIRVPDSKIGWATSLRELIALLYAGKIPLFDLSGLRPAGAPLKTFGGRSSGPEPLRKMFQFVISKFKGAAGRKLNSLECHDIICAIADCVVVGGVRRSALISLSNLTDGRMRMAKTGEWYKIDQNPQRGLANNSVAYTEKPEVGVFMDEWKSLYDSKSGERGIFNRVAVDKKAAENGRRKPYPAFGTNPCGEIILRSLGLCNLSEIVARADDTEESLLRKVRLAAILGTFQSTLTNFRYVRSAWKKNAEEERLLGVSITGIQDNQELGLHADPVVLAEKLKRLREEAVNVNKEWAEKLGINQSVAITTVKPSGTVSQLVNSASGIHSRFAPYYIRTVRNSTADPLSKFLIAQGVPHEEKIGDPLTMVFSFPQKAPDGAICNKDVAAIKQLEHYMVFRSHWCEHNPSITVYVKEQEWFDVQAFVYKHFDDLGGVSFLPHSDHIYEQAPYTETTRDKYEEMVAKMPKIDWSGFFEDKDYTVGSQELACFAGVCEI